MGGGRGVVSKTGILLPKIEGVHIQRVVAAAGKKKS